MTNHAKHNGAIPTVGNHADRNTIVHFLNGALATEIVCALRYQRHHVVARRIHGHTVARELLAYAKEEQRHAELIAGRITELGGPLVFSPEGLLAFRPSECAEGKDLVAMIRETLVAERLAMEAYGEMIRYFGNEDPTSRRLLEGILATEEQHAGELTALIEILRDNGHTPTWPLGVVADSPRRVDSWIDYFGTGDTPLHRPPR